MPFLPPSQQRQSTEGILLDVVEQKVEVEAERRDEVDDVHGGHHERALARAHHEPTRHVTRHVTTAAAWRGVVSGVRTPNAHFLNSLDVRYSIIL